MELNDIIKPENLVYEKPRLMNENPMHYCPGCSHGVIHKLIAEVIADMGLEDKTIGISPWDVPYSHITTWISIGSRQPTDVRQPSLLPLNA